MCWGRILPSKFYENGDLVFLWVRKVQYGWACLKIERKIINMEIIKGSKYSEHNQKWKY